MKKNLLLLTLIATTITFSSYSSEELLKFDPAGNYSNMPFHEFVAKIDCTTEAFLKLEGRYRPYIETPANMTLLNLEYKKPSATPVAAVVATAKPETRPSAFRIISPDKSYNIRKETRFTDTPTTPTTAKLQGIPTSDELTLATNNLEVPKESSLTTATPGSTTASVTSPRTPTTVSSSSATPRYSSIKASRAASVAATLKDLTLE